MMTTTQFAERWRHLMIMRALQRFRIVCVNSVFQAAVQFRKALSYWLFPPKLPGIWSGSLDFKIHPSSSSVLILLASALIPLLDICSPRTRRTKDARVSLHVAR